MRIIAGKAKGVKLLSLKGLDVRPTLDRVKESVFNILTHSINFENKRVLDLFSGTGNLGLESLSRGASFACFVDCDLNSINVLLKNIKRTKFLEKSMVIRKNIFHIKESFFEQQGSFDLIFCDPPYNKGYLKVIMKMLLENRCFFKNSIVVIEHSRFENDFWHNFKSDWFELWRIENFGETQITFLKGKVKYDA